MTSFSSFSLFPLEERLEVLNEQTSLKIGIPKESIFQEKRICLAPDDVAVLVANGHQILVESGAGQNANFSDTDYSEVGAEIVYDTEKVLGCPIVLKVEPPTLNEIAYFSHKAVLISALQIKTQEKAYFEALSAKKITALAFEYIQDNEGNLPVIQSLSEVVGAASVMIASELIANVSNGGSGLLFGNITGIPPIEVVLLGANDVTLSAAKVALGMGASVKVFDTSLFNLRNFTQRLQRPIFTATLQPKILKKALMRCNVLIGAMRGEKRSPIVISEDMVRLMKKGSAIIDTSIDTGGCIETSRLTTLANPTYIEHNVVHYCVPNIASRYARTGSFSLSNILMPIMLRIGEEGGIENFLHTDKGLRNGLYLYHGVVTSSAVSEWFGLAYKPIHLLFA